MDYICDCTVLAWVIVGTACRDDCSAMSPPPGDASSRQQRAAAVDESMVLAQMTANVRD
jgi:hypothetical protein